MRDEREELAVEDDDGTEGLVVLLVNLPVAGLRSWWDLLIEEVAEGNRCPGGGLKKKDWGKKQTLDLPHKGAAR
jgi:hypothetical protein